MNKEAFLAEVQQIVEQNIAKQQLNGFYIASQLGISRMHLHRKLKRAINQNSSEFINNIRLAQAKELLTQSTLSITNISREVGYQDLSYFSKVFKQYNHMSPMQYRKGHQSSAL